MGFSDAEGHFIFNIDSRGYVVFRFIIRLHVDDVEVFLARKMSCCSTLQIGVVRIEDKSAVFVVSDLTSIQNVLLPILDKYPLLTSS